MDKYQAYEWLLKVAKANEAMWSLDKETIDTELPGICGPAYVHLYDREGRAHNLAEMLIKDGVEVTKTHDFEDGQIEREFTLYGVKFLWLED